MAVVCSRWCVALLVLFLSFLIVFISVRLADNPSDPEVDFDAVSYILGTHRL